MSKDGKDVAADGDGRRRRRKGGLRVPSDNVPRKASSSEITAEPAEDPRLAVSVAYAFSEGEEQAGERAARVDATIPDQPKEDAAESVDIDMDDFEDGEATEDADVPTAEDELSELAAAAPVPEAPAPAPAPAGKGAGKASKWPRVKTEALSDADLESLAVGETTAELLEDDLPAENDMPTVVTEEMDEGDTHPGVGGETIPAAVAALEDGAIDAPGAGDSGELLSDDLIEELESSSDVPAETMEISGAELEELREHAQEVKSTPPPAPKGEAAAQAQPPPASKRRSKAKPWFEEIFDENYLRTLPFLTPQSTQAEAKFVIESLAAEPGAQILDIGCGYGRHAMELAARGFHVVGLDSSLPLLLRGADEAQRRGLNINFVHGDMRELTFDSQFDGAYCLFSTFGYFDDETNKRTAQNIAKALKPGARFVIEVLNRDYIIGDLPSRVWWEGDGCVVLEEVEFNYFSSRILSHRSVVFDDGRQLEQEISIRSYSLHELGKLLHAAEFRVLEVSGGMHTRGRFFGGRSRDIIVVAERRPPKERGKRASTQVGIG